MKLEKITKFLLKCNSIFPKSNDGYFYVSSYWIEEITKLRKREQKYYIDILVKKGMFVIKNHSIRGELLYKHITQR